MVGTVQTDRFSCDRVTLSFLTPGLAIYGRNYFSLLVFFTVVYSFVLNVLLRERGRACLGASA